MAHKTGISCHCGTSLVGIFTYTGISSTPKKLENYGYCKKCDQIFSVKLIKLNHDTHEDHIKKDIYQVGCPKCEDRYKPYQEGD